MSTYKMKGRSKKNALPKRSECASCGSLVPISKWAKLGLAEFPGYAMFSQAECTCGNHLVNACVFDGFPIDVASEMLHDFVESTGAELQRESVFNRQGNRVDILR